MLENTITLNVTCDTNIPNNAIEFIQINTHQLIAWWLFATLETMLLYIFVADLAIK